MHVQMDEMQRESQGENDELRHRNQDCDEQGKGLQLWRRLPLRFFLQLQERPLRARLHVRLKTEWHPGPQGCGSGVTAPARERKE